MKSSLKISIFPHLDFLSNILSFILSTHPTLWLLIFLIVPIQLPLYILSKHQVCQKILRITHFHILHVVCWFQGIHLLSFVNLFLLIFFQTSYLQVKISKPKNQSSYQEQHQNHKHNQKCLQLLIATLRTTRTACPTTIRTVWTTT